MSGKASDYAATGPDGKPVVVVPGQVIDSDIPTVGKQGHKCCGGCCDMRRAVIIVNIIQIVFSLLGILSLAALSAVDPENYDDDSVKEAMTGISGASVGVAIGITVIRALCSACGIVGAVKYNVWLVGVGLAAFCIEAIMAIITFGIASLLVAVFFAYPHVFFIREVKMGIMSKENYINEEQSCCCV